MPITTAEPPTSPQPASRRSGSTTTFARPHRRRSPSAHGPRQTERRPTRIAQDSTAHPASHAVAVLFDVTGSMQAVPRILQANLCRLFDLLVDKHYLTDPSDPGRRHRRRHVRRRPAASRPVRIGQPKSRTTSAGCISKGAAGARRLNRTSWPSISSPRKTVIDCWEKRRTKGYAFLIGDEMPYSRVKRREVEHLFGDHLKADIPIGDIVAEVQEKYELYYILPNLRRRALRRSENPAATWQSCSVRTLRAPTRRRSANRLRRRLAWPKDRRRSIDWPPTWGTLALRGPWSPPWRCALAQVGSAAAAAFGWSDPDER